MGGIRRSTVSGNKAIDIIEALKSTILNGGFDVSKPLPSAAYNASTLITHGELFGDVALRLMLQRLSYSSKHPPAEVYIDLPKVRKSIK